MTKNYYYFIEKNRMFYFVNLTTVLSFSKWIFILSVIIIALQKRINETSFYRKKYNVLFYNFAPFINFRK